MTTSKTLKQFINHSNRRNRFITILIFILLRRFDFRDIINTLKFKWMIITDYYSSYAKTWCEFVQDMLLNENILEMHRWCYLYDFASTFQIRLVCMAFYFSRKVTVLWQDKHGISYKFIFPLDITNAFIWGNTDTCFKRISKLEWFFCDGDITNKFPLLVHICVLD